MKCQKNVSLHFDAMELAELIEKNFFLFFAVYNTEFVLEDDVSVMTYRGHVVNKSLIRAKFSPLESTGQRYIYTGDGTGRLISKLGASRRRLISQILVEDIRG